MEVKRKEYYENARPEMLALIPLNSTKILEIGCGQGKFSEQLVKKNTEIWGIEQNEDAAKIASKKLNKVIIGTLEESLNQIPDNYFEVIVLNDVLEHLLYPWDDIRKLRSKLINKGVIVSSIPNVRYSKNLFELLIKKNWEYKEEGILDSTHFRFFTKKSITSLFQKNGYSIIKIKGINVTKSVLYFPLAVLVNIIFLCTQLDIFYMQYATVAVKDIND